MSKETINLSNEEQAVVDALSKLNIVQVNNVVKYLEKAYGISAAPAAVMTAAPAGGSSEAPAQEEKSEVNVELTSAGDQKIAVIKVVREITGLGLKEAKDLVDAAPKVIKEKVPMKDAQEMQKKLGEVGAKVDFK